MTLFSVFGNLQESYDSLKAAGSDISMLHVDELHSERNRNQNLIFQSIYTADGLVFSLQDKNPYLTITRETNNPILRNCREAAEQLHLQGAYYPPREEANRIIIDKSNIAIDLMALNICVKSERTGCSNPLFGYISVSTSDFHHYSEYPELMKLLQRVYGQGRNLTRCLAALSSQGIGETRIYLPNPSYLAEKVKHGPFSLIWWLNVNRFHADLVLDNVIGEHHLYGAEKTTLLSFQNTVLRGTRPYIVNH